MKVIMLLLAIGVLTEPHAFGQAGAGHGGDAVLSVKDSNRMYRLKELFDAKIDDESELVLKAQQLAFQNPSPELKAIRVALGPTLRKLPFDSTTRDGIVYALSRLEPASAAFLQVALGLYTFEFSEQESFVDDFKDPEDFRTDRLEAGIDGWRYRYGVHQAARRIGDRIYISNKVWNYMNKFNRVALVFHELIYAYLKPNLTLRYGQDHTQTWKEVVAWARHLLSNDPHPHRFSDALLFSGYQELKPLKVQMDYSQKTALVTLVDPTDATQHEYRIEFVPFVLQDFETKLLSIQLVE